MTPTLLGLTDHCRETIHLRPNRGDLAIDPGERVVDDRPPLGRIVRRPEPVPVPVARLFVLEELADLGEAEASVVAKALDEPESLQIGLVVQAIVALRTGRGLEQAELFVIAERSRRQAEHCGHLLDAEEGRRRARIGFAGGIEVAHD